ncbi:MAG: penicillin-binding protein [Patescibacteria group bacterium]|nr:penicillin-binding protein [Patescibacteria group bacterium]
MPKNQQSWRTDKKKYYVNRKKSGVLSLKKKSRSKPKKNYNNNLLFDRIKKYFFIFILVFTVLAVMSGIFFVAWLSRSLPDPDNLIEREVAQTTKIYDRSGEEVLYEIHGDVKRTLVTLDDIPDFVEWATIAIEDKNFYSHKGISLLAILRTAVTNVIRGERAGASTLTQQLVKNAVLTTEKTYTRKIKEALIAYKMEQRFEKDEILQMYFNEIPYGSTAYGVEAASQRYFGKSVTDINLAEAAVLSALPQAPSRYSPYGSNKEILISRQHYILDQMAEQQYISQEQADEAKQYILEFQPPTSDIKAPHFVMYIKEILSEKYGEKVVEQGGLKIITTLDLYKQEIAEEIIAEASEGNEENHNASNAGLVSLDPKTGQILAMVGSRDYFNEEIDGQVNITTSLRQPGSSMKPLVYAVSFLKGYTPNTTLYDVVTNFSNDKVEPYEPHNYDLKEHGPVSIRKALAGSLNIPAVKAIYLAGVDSVLDLAEDFGYSTLNDRDRYGMSLVLGGGEVKLLEHTNAFGVFAREGMWRRIVGVLKITDSNGDVLEEFELDEKRVIDPKAIRQINNILSDNDARAYAFGARNWLTLGSRPVAVKTGTTNDYRDAWTIGYTPSIVTGVWVGNFDNTEMKRGSAGGVVAAPIWHDYMERILGDTPVEYFKEPKIIKTGKAILDGDIGTAQTLKIDKVTGMLASENTPEELIEERTFFEPHSILYYVDVNDPLGEAPKNPAKDPQFELWESRVRAWAEKEIASSSSATSTILGEVPPTEIDDVHTPENIPQVSIVTPGNKQTISSPKLDVRLQVSAPRGVKQVDYLINDILFHTTQEYPFNLNEAINFLNNGWHNLKIKVCDDVFNCKTRELEFNLQVENNQNNNTGDFSLEWSSPSSGLAVSNIDFPLKLELKAINSSAIARINFYYEKNSETKTIGSAENINSELVSFNWEEAPLSGTYRLSAEAVSWLKKSYRLSPITIIVNNIN